MSEMNSMLYDIDVVDFTVTELRLYLDTHPDDKEAMEAYSRYAKIKRKLTKDFAAMYYPLCPEDTACDGEWKWGLSPMPWECDANPTCVCKGGR